jgi:hypothetical protein
MYGGLLSLNLLGVMVMHNKAPGGSTRESVAAAYIVTGNAADDRTSDTPLGENRGGGSDACDKRSGERDLTKHQILISAKCVIFIIHNMTIAKGTRSLGGADVVRE